MKVATMNGAAGELESPASAAWSSVRSEQVTLGAIPVASQPTAYIRETWGSRKYASTASAKVAAATDGERLYVRLEWADDAEGNGEFPDAAAAVFGNGEAGALGAPEKPVSLWYWQDGRRDALEIVSRGPGVFRRHGGDGISAASALEGGRWAVVLSGPASVAQGAKLGVAVWNGTNEERAGLGAVSQAWLGLEQA